MISRLMILPVFGLLMAQAGCTDVQPWEKQYLAKPIMALDPDPQERKLRLHVYGTREGAFGGYGVGGGGCGCN